jgi:hypothetical protein
MWTPPPATARLTTDSDLRSTNEPAPAPWWLNWKPRGYIDINAAGMYGLQNGSEMTAQSALSKDNFSGNGDKAREQL